MGNLDMVRLLIDKHGADVNAPGSRLGGGTALHTAACAGHAEVVRTLLATGHDPNAEEGRSKQTPVQSVFLVGRSDIVELLITAGARGPLVGGQMLFRIANRDTVWKEESQR